MPTPEQMDRLRAFGLSDYQAQAYLALLASGEADARAIASQAKVPLGKVYAVLEQLEQKGFARKTAERPRRFLAVPMPEVVDQARHEHLRRAEELAAERAAIAQLFPAQATGAVADDRGSVMLLRGRGNVVERMRNLLGAAERDLLYVAPPGLGRRRAVVQMFEDAAARGLRVRALVPAGAESLPIGVEPRVRASPAEATALLLADDRAALLVHFIPDDGSHAGKDVGLMVEERALVRTLRALAEAAWETAAPAAAPPLRITAGQVQVVP